MTAAHARMLRERYPVALRLYPYRRSADQDAATSVRHPVVVVGAGPVGLAAALDLGLQGIPVVVFDDHEGIGMGSRAICFSKRTLEIADRYGCGAAMLERGVGWNRGNVYRGSRKVYEFDLLPEEGHAFPAFINLSQVEFERLLVERLRQLQETGAPIDLRGGNRVGSIDVRDDGITLDIDTPEGDYRLDADWLIACDGAGSSLRDMLGLEFIGRAFHDSFLIADIRMGADLPAERRFWFDPDFRSAGASALLHRQPDDVWRVDFQIGWDVDRAEELREENVRRRLDAMLGPDADYEIVWSSIYTFQCRRLRSFRHGRVFFAGDAAHQVSPFGARGANSGLQDIDNLGWKLGLVHRRLAPESLLDSYDEERVRGADENILHSTRSTDFISPKSPASRVHRDAVLDLAAEFEFARPLVNSGRLSLPCHYEGLSLTGPDQLAGGPARSRPGRLCPDAPLNGGHLLGELGSGFTILSLDTAVPDLLEENGILVRGVAHSRDDDRSGRLAERYLGAAASAVYLVRPDQHIAARWAGFDAPSVRTSLRRTCGEERPWEH